MTRFTLRRPAYNNLADEIRCISELIYVVSNCSDNNISIDMTRLNFGKPSFITTLLTYLNYVEQGGRVVSLIEPGPQTDLHAYLNTIEFYNGGVKPEEVDFEAKLLQYTDKNYIPIVTFPTSMRAEDLAVRNSLFSSLGQLIQQTIAPTTNIRSGLVYLLSELTDNIVEHSNSNRGWLFVQYFEALGCIEICISDLGRTIKGSYVDNQVMDDHDSDISAIRMAMEGVSTKTQERGFGIPTSRNIALEGLSGNFALISGNGILFDNSLTSFGNNINWPGTSLCIKINRENSNFNVLDYA